MTDRIDPRTGELVTTHYGWTKPNVAGSPDAWGGYINANLDAQDGQLWSLAASLNSYLPLAGGTLTGPLVLAADPATALQPATKQYVDARAPGINDNRIINGDMRIDQRNNGSSGTAVGYTVDRWYYLASQASKGSWQRITGGAPLLALGLGYSLNFQTSSAYTSASGETFAFYQPVEADMVTDFAWGTANAQPVTLSFWVNCSLTGAFSGSIRNYPVPATRSYPFTFSIPVANTWTKISITIPGDTAGTWVLQGNAAAFALVFDLGSGASLRGPANAWAGANYAGASGSVSVVATNSASFSITGVKLEIGSIATPFPRESLAKRLADCQRYYQQPSQWFLCGYAAAGTGMFNTFPLNVVMRAAPTVTFPSPTYANASALTAFLVNPDMVTVRATVTAVGQGQAVSTPVTLSAEL